MIRLRTLSYIANNRIPSDKAHSIYVLKMCDAFASILPEVELVIPFRFSGRQKRIDPFAALSLQNHFHICRIPSPDFIPLEKVIVPIAKMLYFVQCIIFALFTTIRAAFSPHRSAYVTSDIWVGLFLHFAVPSKVVLDMHVLPQSWIRKSILKYMLSRGIAAFAVTNGMRNSLIKDFNAYPDKVHVLPNAYDDRLFNTNLDKLDARKLCGFQEDAFIIGYVGRFKTMGEGKGIENLVEAMRILKDAKIILLLVGDDESLLPPHSDIRIVVVPHVPQARLLPYLRSCDIAVMPFPRTPHYEKNMSPMKLFEYMASGISVIAADLPSIREVVSEREVMFIEDNSSEKIAEAVNYLMHNPDYAGRLVETAFKKIQGHTWKNRAVKFISFIEGKTKPSSNCE